MTAEQIAKLVAECREDLAVMPENNGFRNFRIAKRAPSLCNALEAAQKREEELRKLVGEMLMDADALAVDLRNAAKGYGVGNLNTKANVAESILERLRTVARVSELKGGAK